MRSAMSSALTWLRREEGQTLILGIGTITVVLALILVTASATAVYLDVKTLTSLADSAAAAGANGVGEEEYFDGEAGPLLGVLTDESIQEAAVQDLTHQARAVEMEGLRIVRAEASDSTTAMVTLQAYSRPPFLPWGILPAEGITITATGSARVTTVN